MAFYAGQTFLFPLTESTKPHLWVIATEPNSEDVFAIVSLTTLREAQDQTVLFRKDEHKFLKHDTCVCYSLATIIQAGKLQRYLDEGQAKIYTDLAAPLLAEVLDGFTASDFTKNRVRDFVRNYKEEGRQKVKSENQTS